MTTRRATSLFSIDRSHPLGQHRHHTKIDIAELINGAIVVLSVMIVGLICLILVLLFRPALDDSTPASPASLVTSSSATTSSEIAPRAATTIVPQQREALREESWSSGLGSVVDAVDLEDVAIATPRNGERANPYVDHNPPQPLGSVDDLVWKRFRERSIEPAALCSDEVFLRRIYIDVLGTLPTAEEARRFLDDQDPQKRAKLIDEVLEQPEFAVYWAMKWSDLLRVKAEFPIKLWPQAAQAYHRWIHAAIESNMPYDDFARALLTTSGSNFRTPQVNFYRALQSKEPQGIAQAVALTFLGERTERWPTERVDALSSFFSQVGYKPTNEWKEEIVYFDRRKGRDSTSLNQVLTTQFPDGVQVQITPGEDPRQVFADWLVKDDNPWFARALANRVWFWLLGRGIVDPPDDAHADNPPSDPALLEFLANQLILSDYDIKHLLRVILTSRTYQLACIPNSDPPPAAEYFAYYPIRRLEAEVLIDAICQITDTSESYSSIIPEPYTFLPAGTRAIALPDGSITSSFLEMFGRPTRDTGIESDRNNRLTAAQALHLLNSNHIRNKLKQGSGIRELLRATSDMEPAETLYLAILSRRPTSEELGLAAGICSYPEGAATVAWALINSDEFLFRH